jgi:glycosyltransferase involved in cell wall biosynthesis
MPGIPADFAQLLTKVPSSGENGYDATLTFAPPFDIKISPRMAKRRIGLPVHIAPVHYGWSMWEKSQLTHRDMTGHGIGLYPWSRLTAMYATTDVSIEAFRHYDPKIEYRLLPCGIDPDLFPVTLRPLDGPTRFVMVGELHIRKDPFVAIQAYQELRAEHGPEKFDAELHLKTTVPGLHKKLEEWSPGIHIYTEYWPYRQLLDWLATMTCYVGPSRGEGNLKPPMEFMAMGGPVIATNWSGPTNWLTAGNGWPLDYKLMPLDPADPDGPLEARASKEHLKELMWYVHTHREEARLKGDVAAEYIREVAHWGDIVDRLIVGIEEDLDG